MAISILDPLKDRQGGVRKSADWYRTNIQNLGSINRRKLMASGRLNGIPSAGRLNMFFYDPKFKKQLPYYDVFPLVLPLETIPGGFMGLNFHYIPPLQRFKLLQFLHRFATGGMKSNTRINATWDGVKGFGVVKKTIKKYLYNHVRSSFLRIDFDESAMAVYLPVQQFRKGKPY